MCVCVSSRYSFTRLIWGFFGEGLGGRAVAGAKKVFNSRGVKLEALSPFASASLWQGGLVSVVMQFS